MGVQISSSREPKFQGKCFAFLGGVCAASKPGSVCLCVGRSGYLRDLYTVNPVRLDTSEWPHMNDSQAHLHMCVRMQGLLVTRAGVGSGTKTEVSRLEPVTQTRIGFSLGCDSTSDFGGGEVKARLTREKALVPRAQHFYQMPPPTPRPTNATSTHTPASFVSFPL